MFIRGRIGARIPSTMEIGLEESKAAIEENWLKPGKMLSWNMFDSGFRILGPKFEGTGVDDGLALEFYAFPTQELFMEWCFSPEHIGAHQRLVKGVRAFLEAGGTPPPSYNFHATDAPGDIRELRAQLRKVYAEMEKTEWVNMPPGAVQAMMLGDDD